MWVVFVFADQIVCWVYSIVFFCMSRGFISASVILYRFFAMSDVHGFNDTDMETLIATQAYTKNLSKTMLTKEGQQTWSP